MDKLTRMAVGDAFHEAWRLRYPFLLSHLIFNFLRVVVLAPVVALAVRAAIALSGEPALSDFDIAFFLLSPTGFVAAVLIVSLLLTTNVLDVAFMMAIAQRARRTGERRFEDGVARILPRLPRIIGFAWRLLLRVLLISIPFVLLSLWIASTQLTEFDINYYLAEHPPEFIRAVVMIGALLAIMTIILLRYLLGWAVALPHVLFDDVSPRKSFPLSVGEMDGRRMALLKQLMVWGAIAMALVTIVFGIVRFLAEIALDTVGQNLEALALVLMVLLAIWSLLNWLATTVNAGALAVLLMDCAGWPGSNDLPMDMTLTRRWLPRIILAGAAAGAVVLISGASDLARHDTPEKVLVIAHRGAAGSKPENTMAAFEQAINDEADYVELDVQESADDEIIVMHDSDYMKIASVDLKAWDATVPGLTDIDIGSWFDPEFAAERTPLLRDVLELAKGTGSDVLIELKYYDHDRALEQRVADVVDETGMQDNVMLMSLKYEGVQKMKALRPEWKVGLLATASVGALWDLEADFVAVNASTASHHLVRKSREAGKDVYVWTVNEPLAMSQMISLGVNGLITDEPGLAREVIAQRDALNGWDRLVLALGSELGLSASDKVYRDASP